MPFIAIALSVFFARGIAGAVDLIIVEGRAFKIFKVLVVFLAGGIIFMSTYLYHKPGRDEIEIRNSEVIAQAIGENKAISAPFSIYEKWAFQFYLSRYYNITLDAGPGKHEFLLLELDADINGYERIKTSLTGYNLYRKIN